MAWAGGIAEWIEEDTAFVSVAFSWKLPEAYQRAQWHRSLGYKVRVGGPGLFAHRGYFKDIAEESDQEIDALSHHNPEATMASRGCPVGCWFCIVPKSEGRDFTLLPEFIPKPVLCDNNLSALPVDYQKFIIEKYKAYKVPLRDANSGFEPRTFDEGTYIRWKEINRGVWRFGYDETREGDDVFRMTQILKNERAPTKRVYVLLGNEPFEACYRRIMQVIEWGCEPFAQPMIMLNALTKTPAIRYDWTEKKLAALTRWTNRWVWRVSPFSKYKYFKEVDD